jgi:hypothetical protein
MQITIQIPQQRINIAIFIQRFHRHMGVEVTVGTLLQTPRDMHIERQRRQFWQSEH